MLLYQSTSESYEFSPQEQANKITREVKKKKEEIYSYLCELESGISCLYFGKELQSHCLPQSTIGFYYGHYFSCQRFDSGSLCTAGPLI